MSPLSLSSCDLLRRHQKLEHEAATAACGEKIGQALQAGRLACVQRAVALRVVAHQHFAEGRIERFDVAREILAIFEIEFVLPAFLRRASGGDVLGGGVAQNGGAELLVHQDAGLLLRHAAGERAMKAVVDHLLGAGDLGCLRIAQRRLPAEHFGLERAAMIEGQNIEWAIISSRHQAAPLSLRYRRISVFVELSCSSFGSVALSSSGMIRWARALPSSTPHWSKESICQIVPWVKTMCS